MTLKLLFLIQSCHMSSYFVLRLIVPGLHDMRMVCLLKVITPFMGYNYGSIHYSNRLHPFLRFVCYTTGQRQMSFIGQACVSGPACLKQTLLCAQWTDQCIFHVYFLGLLGEYLEQVS